MIDLTVALPTFNNKNILWLQLESLIKQITTFDWELIVCEEQTKNMFGESSLLKYKERLQSVNCVKLKYIPLKNHIPLSKKWHIIAEAAEGYTFTFCASDDYSSPNRLEISHKYICDGYDWFDVKKALFLNLNSFNTATYIDETGWQGTTMSTQTNLMRDLNGPWPSSIVDKWIKSKIVIKNHYQHPNNLLGLHTDGANLISLNRWTLYPDGENRVKFISPFSDPEQQIEDILPADVIKKLKDRFLKKKDFDINIR
jgi:hypothetical protein